MSCNCIEQIDKALEPHNTLIVATMSASPPMAIISTMKRRKLRDGKSPKTLIATFCPFCGVRYQTIDEMAKVL